MAAIFGSCLALVWLFTACWLTAQPGKDPSWLLGFLTYGLGFFGAVILMWGLDHDRSEKKVMEDHS